MCRRIDIGVHNVGDRSAIDPAQERKAALMIHADDTGNRINVIALHQIQRAHFGRQPVARIIRTRRILLERKFLRAGSHMINAAVAAAADQALDLCRRADKRINDVLALASSRCHLCARKTCSSMSRHVGQTI